MSNPYCGYAKVPKGRVRGTLQQCKAMKQLRYYGIEQFDPAVINQLVDLKIQYDKAMANFTKYASLAKKLVSDLAHNKRLAAKPETTDAMRIAYKNERSQLLLQRDKILPKYVAAGEELKRIEALMRP